MKTEYIFSFTGLNKTYACGSVETVSLQAESTEFNFYGGVITVDHKMRVVW